MTATFMGALRGAASSGERFYGVVTAVVTDVDDPEDLGRVRLHFPWLGEEGTAVSAWARVAVAAAGKASGTYVIPDVGDHVVVGFEHGDLRAPYVLGALWTSDAPPPVAGDATNAVREWRTPAGHVVRLDDTKDAERIEVVDSSATVRVVLDTAAGTVTVTGAKGVTLTSDDGPVTLRGAGIVLESSKDVEVTAQGGLALEAGGTATLKGTTVEIN